MGSILNFFFSFILCVSLLTTLASANSPFLSYDIFESGAFRGRSLLQSQQACKVDFEKEDYTVLTSQCKGPNYPPKICCEAFKQFACPYAEVINDPNTDCAAAMFDYIDIYGHYPTGLFFDNCKEGEEGLDCRNVKPFRRTGHHVGRKHKSSKSAHKRQAKINKA